MNKKNALQLVGKPTSLALVSTVALLLLAAPAFAAPATLDWGAEVNAGQCETKGKPVVNVTQTVLNTVDSGEGGNNWAFDDLNRRIQVWDLGAGSYCAVVNYQGYFDAVEGQQSPGKTELLDGDEDGTFQGGYRMLISGDLLAEPAWPTRGSAGVTDYECTIAGVCPGEVSWIAQYFAPGFEYTYAWWGWIYHGGQHGTWVNSSEGNTGDIA